MQAKADKRNLEANHRTQPISVDILMGERPPWTHGTPFNI